MLEALFYIFLFPLVLFFSYPAILYATLAFRKEPPKTEADHYPNVSIIIPAFNEEEVIEARIKNVLELDYPDKNIEIIVGSDGSTDNTVEVLKGMDVEGLRVLDFKKNRGRSQVHNDCVKVATGDIIFFTDADTSYHPDCIKEMVKHYKNPVVGAVGGELASGSFKEGSIGGGLGIYWRYEYTFRRLQSRLGVLTKVSGANSSMLKELFKPLPANVDIDQMAGPTVIMQGYKVVHEPDGIAYETFPVGMKKELSSRVRFTIRALTAISLYRRLFNPLNYGWISINEIIYRLSRYLIPFFLIGIFINNALIYDMFWPYRLSLLGQIAFYSMAVFGYVSERFHLRVRLFSVPFSFVYFNIGILIGVMKFLAGHRLERYDPV